MLKWSKFYHIKKFSRDGRDDGDGLLTAAPIIVATVTIVTPGVEPT